MDSRDSAECQNWEKKDIIGIKGKDLNDNKTKHSIVFVFSNVKKGEKRELEQGGDAEGLEMVFLVRERVFILSRNTRDPTVGSLRNKKESCSTQRGLRVGTRFREFPQTPRGRCFSLLGFYSSFKCIYNVCVE